MNRFENHIQITITMGGTVSAGKSNDELIDHLVEADFIKTPSIQRVFRAVDRGNYYTADQKQNAYKDIAWRMGNLHLSAPCVYSVVMEALKLTRGLSFLNLGSGSGYLSTMAGLVLGPFGINHGIELYTDIVDFAYERLEEFVKNAKAVDEYEFCEPVFTVGNCLSLDRDLHRYDRVYCGASCPAEYEDYMKSLVKVGGILVMPLNDKLLKLTRVNEDEWHSVKVLSVSFAPLVSPPDLKDPTKSINLGDMSPPKLQHICRASIRTLLRSFVDAEHPNLKERQLWKESSPRKQVRRIVIPFIDESGESEAPVSDTEGDLDSDGAEYTISSHLPSRMSVFLEDFLRRHAEMQLLKEMEEQQQPKKRTDTEVSSADSPEKSKKDTKDEVEEVEKADDTHEEEDTEEEGGESESSSAQTLSDNQHKTQQTTAYLQAPGADESRTEGSSDNEMFSLITVSNLQQATSSEDECTTTTTDAQTRRRRPLKRKRTSENEASSSSGPPKRRAHRTAATVVWKKFVEVKKDNNSPPKEEENAADEENYTSLMIQKIGALPLPAPLLRYLNYRRDNL